MKNETNLYAVSTSVGSGKTHAAIRYMNDGTFCNQNFIYVAPTKLLLEQTAQNLRQAISQRTGQDGFRGESTAQVKGIRHLDMATSGG